MPCRDLEVTWFEGGRGKPPVLVHGPAGGPAELSPAALSVLDGAP